MNVLPFIEIAKSAMARLEIASRLSHHRPATPAAGGAIPARSGNTESVMHMSAAHSHTSRPDSAQRQIRNFTEYIVDQLFSRDFF
jgi:hypothetical protein